MSRTSRCAICGKVVQSHPRYTGRDFSFWGQPLRIEHVAVPHQHKGKLCPGSSQKTK